MAQAVQRLPHKHEALSSSPNTTKKTKPKPTKQKPAHLIAKFFSHKI
jgi:hypothetical protein